MIPGGRFSLDKPRGTWDMRRQMAVRTLEYCGAFALIALVFPWIDKEVAKTGVTSAFFLAGSVVGAYLGAATTHDYLHRQPADPPKPPPVKAVDEPIG